MPKTIMLLGREISEEELNDLAPFAVLWPRYLPEGYSRGRILELSETATESSGSGIFIIELTDQGDGALLIQQSRHMRPDLSNKREIGSLGIMNTNIPVFQGELLSFAFFKRGDVHVELVFRGISIKVVEDIASSLTA